MELNSSGRSAVGGGACKRFTSKENAKHIVAMLVVPWNMLLGAYWANPLQCRQIDGKVWRAACEKPCLGRWLL